MSGGQRLELLGLRRRQRRVGQLAEHRELVRERFRTELADAHARAARSHVDVVRRRHSRLPEQLGVDQSRGRRSDSPSSRSRSRSTTISAGSSPARTRARTTSPRFRGPICRSTVTCATATPTRAPTRSTTATAATSARRTRSSIASRPRSRTSISTCPTAIAPTRSTAARR